MTEREDLRRERFEQNLAQLIRDYERFRNEQQELRTEIEMLPSDGWSGVSLSELVRRLDDAARLAHHMCTVTEPAVDRTWTTYEKVRSWRRPSEIPSRERAASRRPWSALREPLSAASGELARTVPVIVARWTHAARRSSVEDVAPAEEALGAALDAVLAPGARDPHELYVTSRVEPKCEDLERTCATWHAHWAESLGPPGRSPELEAATETLTQVTDAAAALVTFAREVRGRVAPKNAIGFDADGRAIVNAPRPRPMIEQFPVGWDRVVPTGAPSVLAELVLR